VEGRTGRSYRFLSHTFIEDDMVHVLTEQRGRVVILRPQERRLDAKVAVAFKEFIAKTIDAGLFFIVLDLSQVEFIDSSGLGAIVTAVRMLSRRGDVVITGVQGEVQMMFSLTRMDKVFRVFATTDEAVTALS
jgi:anti-sigma B factor antagonist